MPVAKRGRPSILRQLLNEDRRARGEDVGGEPVGAAVALAPAADANAPPQVVVERAVDIRVPRDIVPDSSKPTPPIASCPLGEFLARQVVARSSSTTGPPTDDMSRLADAMLLGSCPAMLGQGASYADESSAQGHSRHQWAKLARRRIAAMGELLERHGQICAQVASEFK